MLKKLTNKQVFLILLIAGVIVFGNSLFNGFVGDEFAEFYNNHVIQPFPSSFLTFLESQADPHNFYSFFGTYYRPLPFFYFSMIRSLFGLTPVFFRLPIIALHILNSFFVFLLLSRFFKRPFSLAASLIFLVHPINQELVVYVAVAQEAFYFFCGMSALLLFTSSHESFNKKLYSLILFLLALLSKETALLFIGVSALYLFFFSKKNFFKNGLLLTLPILAYASLRFISLFHHVTYIVSSGLSDLSLSQRSLSMPRILWFYISSFFNPQNTSIIPRWTVSQINLGSFYIPLLLDFVFLVLISTFFFYLWKTSHLLKTVYALFFIWFVSGILLHMQILPLDQTVAARWFYFPFVGALGIIGVVFEKYYEFLHKHFKIIAILFAIILLYFSGKTMMRNRDFQNVFTLYTNDMKLEEEGYYFLNNIGDQLFKQGDTEGAITYFKKALSINPKMYIAWNNLGVAYENKGNYTKAAESYQKAIAGNFLPGYESMARLILLHKNAKEAKTYTENALKKFPDSATLWLTLALSNYELHQYPEALQTAQKSYKLSPDEKTFNVISAIQKKLFQP